MAKLDRLGWAVGQSYEIGGVRIGLRTTSPDFGRWLERALDHYRVEDVPDAALDDYSIVVADGGVVKGPARRGYHILYRGSVDIVRTLHLPSFGRALLSELEGFLHPEQADVIYLNAVAVRSGEAVVLVPSFLTTALGRFGRRLARSNMALGEATRVAVDPDSGRLITPPPLLDVPHGIFAGLEEISGPNGKGDRFSIDGSVRVDAVLVLDDRQQPSFEPTSKGRTLHQLAAGAVNLRKTGGRSLAALAQLVDGSRCYGFAALDSRATLEALASVSAPA